MSQAEFLNDIEQLALTAKNKLSQQSNTTSYPENKNDITDVLNIMFATEIVCSLRYKNHYYKAKQLGANDVADEFLEHANQEKDHADQLADRIAQLGVIPNMNPEYITSKNHSDYKTCNTVAEMIKENLLAEHLAVETYRHLIQKIGNTDPTTRRILEEILATEEEHVDDLSGLKQEFSSD